MFVIISLYLNPHRCFSCHKVFDCFGKYFCLHFEAFMLQTAPVYMAFLCYMGEAEEANNFRYSLEVGGSRRRQMWQGVPRSIRDSHQKVRDSVDGLLVPRRLALFFSGGDYSELKLRVMGRIWKEQWVSMVIWMATQFWNDFWRKESKSCCKKNEKRGELDSNARPLDLYSRAKWEFLTEELVDMSVLLLRQWIDIWEK